MYIVLVVRGGVATMWGPFEVRNFLFFFQIERLWQTPFQGWQEKRYPRFLFNNFK